MGSSIISLGLGLGGGKSATSSGRLSSGGSISNILSSSFDGSDDSLSFGTSTLFNTGSAFSFSAWIKISSYSNTYQSIAQFKTNHSNGFHLLASDGATYTGLNIGSNDETNMMKVKTAGDVSGTFLSWTHIAMTYNGSGGSTSSNYKVYVNGSEVSLTSTDGYASLTNVNSLGGGNGGSAFYFNGLMDEVATFDSLLSSSDVTAIYNSGSPADLTSLSPVTWYRMGDGTGDTDSGGGTPASGDTIGTVVDQGSGSNNATGTNGPTYSNSVPVVPFSTKSVEFDGSDDYMDCGGDSVFSFTDGSGNDNPFSVSAWVKLDANGTQRVVSKGNIEWLFGTNGSGLLSLFLWGSDGTSNYLGATASGLSTGTWHHIVATYDGSNTVGGIKLYLAGSAETVSNASVGSYTGMASQQGSLRVGQWEFNSSCMNGIADEVAVFNSELSASDVTAIYNSGVPADLTSLNPLGWWRMGDGTEAGSGTTVFDMSTNSNNGTLTNGPTYSSTVPS